MANSPLMDPGFEAQLWGELEQRQVAQQAAQSYVTPQTAALASSLSRTYPWLDPGVIQSLTLAGQGPNSSVAQLVAQAGAEVGLEDGEFEDPYSTIPDSQLGALLKSTPSAFNRAVQNGLRGALAVLAYPYEEIFERGIPAFAGARLEFEEAQDPERGHKKGFQPELPDYLFSGEFWDDYRRNYEQAAPPLLEMTIGDILDPNTSPKLFGFDPKKGEGLMAAYQRRQNLRGLIAIPGVSPTTEDPWAHAMTFGRAVAYEVSEPGTGPYKVLSGILDFGANLVPVDLGVGKVARAGRVAMGLGSAKDIINAGGRIGLLPGITKQVDTSAAINNFLGKQTGGKLVEWLRDTDDLGQIWQALGRPSPALAKAFRDATDTETVVGLLRESLGSQMRVPTAGLTGQVLGIPFGRQAELFGVGASLRRSTRNIRLTHEMPKRPLNPDDLNDAARTVHDYIRNARMGDDRLNHYLGEIARIQETGAAAKADGTYYSSANDLYQVIVGDGGLYDETFKRLMDEDLFARKPGSKPRSARQAREITRAWKENVNDSRIFFMEETGKHADLAPITITAGGKATDIGPTVHLLSERLASSIPLPDIGEIKRATGFLNQVWDGELGKLTRGSATFMNWTLGTTWKAMQLVTRFAYPIRVISEEQARLAAVGVSSAFRHPIDYLAWVLGHSPDSRLAQTLVKAPGLEARGARGALGQEWEHINEFQAAMSRGRAGIGGAPGWALSGRFERMQKYTDDTMVMSDRYLQGVLDELRQLHSDPVARRVAGGLGESDLQSLGLAADDLGADSLDTVKEWYWQGNGQGFREELARDPEWRSLIDGKEGMTAREVSDAYVDSVARRIQVKTNQNPALMEAVGKGSLDGTNIMSTGKNAKAKTALEQYEDSLPDWVKVETLESIEKKSQWDRITETLFSWLMAGPTNRLSRSPFFRQAYWGEMERLMGFADPNTQEAIIRSARDMGKLTRSQQRDLAKIATTTSGTQLTSLADADTLAKAFALDATRNTLYDLARRNQFFESTRLLFPFGEAWKEVLGTWTKIITERPSVLRRGQQAIEGAMGPGFGDLTSEFLGTGTLPGQGFIYEDPSVEGQLIFNYPGSVLASRFLMGEGSYVERFAGMFDEDRSGFGFTAPLSGLNLFTATILPGIGPSVQLPMAAFTNIFNKELPVALHDVIFPFGEPPIEEEGFIGATVESFTPTWFTRIFRDAMANPDSHRLLANTVMDVAKSLVANGTHSTDSQDEINRLYDDAVDRARLLFWIRGIAQSTVPAGPSVRWHSQDAQGNWVFVQAMIDEYRGLIDKYEGDTNAAMDEYIRTYGTENLLALQGKSRSLKYRPLDAEGDAWLRANPDLERDHDLVIGFFVPEPRDAAFDLNAYHRTFDTGSREQLAPKQALLLHNQYVARTIFEEAKRKVAGRYDDQADAYLANVKQQLAEQYEGFTGYIGVDERPTIEQLITKLEQAVEDPRLANAPATEAIKAYFQARAAAQATVDANPSAFNGAKGFQDAKSARYLRDWLRYDVAAQLKAKYPEFVPVWQFVFERELNEADLEDTTP